MATILHVRLVAEVNNRTLFRTGAPTPSERRNTTNNQSRMTKDKPENSRYFLEVLA
jgi:hypothetical protein